MKYRLNSVDEIEAIQYTGDNIKDILTWAGKSLDDKRFIDTLTSMLGVGSYLIKIVSSGKLNVWPESIFNERILDRVKAAGVIGLDELPLEVDAKTIRWLIEHGYAIDKIDERPTHMKVVIINHDTVYMFAGNTLEEYANNDEVIANAVKRHEKMNGVVYDTTLKEVPWDGHFSLKEDDYGEDY